MDKKDNYTETYRDSKINAIHSWVTYGLLLDIALVLKEFFDIEIYFKSVALRILVYFIIPYILGAIKVAFIDPFFDKINVTIKWIFAFLVFGILIFMGVYSFITYSI